FTNFYICFISNFSSVVHPLTSLLKDQPKSLSWSHAASKAFEELKKTFTTALLLAHPNPAKLFMVEVVASSTGVGVVLPQQLLPCAFFSRKPSSAEMNYDIGDKELLPIKLTFEVLRN
ncbi:hypothetical protein M9458_010485, partial [Cirrhinus mrigala]